MKTIRCYFLGVVLAVMPPFFSGSALAGEQAEKALASVRALLASGEVKRDAVIRVAFKSGNIAALLGPSLELQKEWEQRTGIMITATVVPQQPAQLNLKANPEIDLTVARTHEYADLLDQGLIEDLAPMARRFGFSLDGRPPAGFIRPRLQAYSDDKLAAIPADGDVALVYLRRDLMESPAERAAFLKAFGRELKPPVTWMEYEQLASFFHRPQKGLYGAGEQRERDSGWMFWLPRYLSQGEGRNRLFDDNFKPLIDSPAGIAATESYVRLVRYSPPEILQDGKDYSYTMPLFMQGKAFSAMFTIAGAKLINVPNSPVRNKFMASPLPGNMVGGKLVRANPLIYGNNIVVSSRGTQRTLAFLFTMWLTDPDISLRTVGVKGGFTDPFRWNHIEDPRIRELYSADALAVFAREWEFAVPSGTGLPGDGELLDSLNGNLWLAAAGKLSAADAMRRTAQEWDKIVRRQGREKLQRWLNVYLGGFSNQDPPGRTGK